MLIRHLEKLKKYAKKMYSIRVADYRIIYEITDKVLLIDVIDLGHRSNIYE
ncbi:type II toxin-antitoxin system RelE family toxin [Tunicatimonas sp.]|uniref:type II toxin-antitoxin system RelE family toxin n=1 Tax=Tunicatimonas sp. TaxID=1940096 RepID=UPI003C72D0F6